MSLSRSTVAFMGVGILGISGVGLGAGATFTDATQVVQTITAGTIDVRMNSVGALGNGTKSIELPALGPVASTFRSAPVTVTMTNKGTIMASERTIRISGAPTAAGRNKALWDELSVAVVRSDGSFLFDGKLSDLATSSNYAWSPLDPGGVRTYTIQLYAGGATANKGTAQTAGSASLTDAAQGGVVKLTLAFGFDA